MKRRADIAGKRAPARKSSAPPVKTSQNRTVVAPQVKTTPASAVPAKSKGSPAPPSAPRSPTTKPGSEPTLIFGRKTVLQALQDKAVEVTRLWLFEPTVRSSTTASTSAGNAADSESEVAESAGGGAKVLASIRALSLKRTVPLRNVETRKELTELTNHPRQDQAVAAHVVPPYGTKYHSVADLLKVANSRKSKPLTMLALDGVASASNMGTILRSAVASDAFDGIILTPECVNVFNPMVSFASCGVSLNQKYYYAATDEDWQKIQKEAKMEIYTLSPHKRNSVDLFDFAPKASAKTVYVLGGESTGISKLIAKYSDKAISIPMAKQAESLSVASATAIVAYYHRWKTAQAEKRSTARKTTKKE